MKTTDKVVVKDTTKSSKTELTDKEITVNYGINSEAEFNRLLDAFARELLTSPYGDLLASMMSASLLFGVPVEQMKKDLALVNPTDKQKIKFLAEAKRNGLIGRDADNYVKMQMSLWDKEQRKKASEEAELLGRKMQQLLPDIFEDKRAIPNCFLRGALFGMVRKGRRALVGDMPIFTMSQYDLTFTGYELDQNDLEVWDTLMYLAKERKVDNDLRITLYDLCQQMRLTNNGKTLEALKNRIARLKVGTVKIKLDDKEFGGSLINNYFIDTEGDGKLVIEYNKRLTPLFIDGDYTLISADIRHLLGDNQLARWLYSFYESHKEPIPFTIDFIQKLCRSESALKEFKRLLKNALELVKKAHLSVNHKSRWDYEISKNSYLLVYPKGKTKKQLELFSKF